MGNRPSIQKNIYSYKDIQMLIRNPAIQQDKLNSKYILINTLPSEKQFCLIKNTCPIDQEERIVNELLNHKRNVIICIYGENTCDTTIFEKYRQLHELGFINIYLYVGGLFEWLCLQDIYSSTYFETTGKHNEILDYAPRENREFEGSPNISHSNSFSDKSLLGYLLKW